MLSSSVIPAVAGQEAALSRRSLLLAKRILSHDPSIKFLSFHAAPMHMCMLSGPASTRGEWRAAASRLDRRGTLHSSFVFGQLRY